MPAFAGMTNSGKRRGPATIKSGRELKATGSLDADYRDHTDDYHRVASLFARHREDAVHLRALAAEAAKLTEQSGRFIQEHTAAVCPSCMKVCCVNRHSYHEIADIIYLCALGEAIPAYTQGIADADPCQFMGERGCTLPRLLRPHRCNWYFCLPLLGHMQAAAAREYRRFMELSAELSTKRTALIDGYGSWQAAMTEG